MTTEKPKSFPLAGQAQDGWSTEDEATATCFCGAIQIVVPIKAPGLVNTFVCNCADCHKITASMFASNFTVRYADVRFTRGQENLKAFAQARTIAAGNTMTNYFCDTCGTLMYRGSSGYPDVGFYRIGTLDDFSLIETNFRPQHEQFLATRPDWLPGVEGAKKWQQQLQLEK